MHKCSPLTVAAFALTCALPMLATAQSQSSQSKQQQPAAKRQSAPEQHGAKTPKALLKQFGQGMKTGDSDAVKALVDQSSKQGQAAARLMGQMASVIHASRQFRQTVTKKFGKEGWKEIKSMPGMSLPSPDQFQSIQDKIKHAKVRVHGDTAVATVDKDQSQGGKNNKAGKGDQAAQSKPKAKNKSAKVRMIKHDGLWYMDMGQEQKGYADKAAFMERMFSAMNRRITQATRAARESKSIDGLKQTLLAMQQQRAGMAGQHGANKPQPQPQSK